MSDDENFNYDVDAELDRLEKIRYYQLLSEFSIYAKRFDLDDWEALRTEDYWNHEGKTRVQVLEHKLKFMKHYDKFGQPFKDDLNL
jgi:hypothetical protein